MGGPISTSSWVHLPAGVKARLFRFSAALLLTSGHANIPRGGLARLRTIYICVRAV
jgi:hypothetical protein